MIRKEWDMTPIKVQLTFIRSSKNYHVYQAELGAPVIPDKLYIRQDVLGPDAPEVMTMVLSTDGMVAGQHCQSCDGHSCPDVG